MNTYHCFLNRIITFALGVFIGNCAIVDPAFADEWQWIRVSPDTTPNHVGWQILQGKADVKIKDGKISTELKYDDENYYYHYLIGGTVNKNNEVSVTEIQENTDAGPRRFVGNVEKVAEPKSDWEYDRIILKKEAIFITFFRIKKR